MTITSLLKTPSNSFFKTRILPPIAGLYTYIFKPTCANSGCHDGTFRSGFRRWKVPTNTLVFRESIKKDGKYLYRVKPYSLDSSAILAP
ncbi:MAG: hypothetical protein IPI30_21520 [Saprospiraceae bacterium]|nr:hypothetical protein [Candidatus Vicinibacter affinis]